MQARRGATDDLGIRATQTKPHVHDLHATVFWLLGLGHMELVYKCKSRPERPALRASS